MKRSIPRMLSSIPKFVRIVEVGPRDGLQNEKNFVSAQTKLEFIDRLYKAGLRSIEAGAFVSPKWVPQMADTEEIFSELGTSAETNYPLATFSALTPNMKGLESAMKLGVKEVAVFGAASESFSRKNINCSIEESLGRFNEVCKVALENNIKVRGYVSCVLGCPYENEVSPDKVLYVTKKLLEMGCYEVSLGDTIGTGNAGSTSRLLDVVTASVPVDKIAVHFHDTYGQALSNIYVALQYGISVVDASTSGLGGCPYAKGASGNVATEDVVYMLNGMNITTNIDMSKLVVAGEYMDSMLNNRLSQSKVSKAFRAKKLDP